jgi:hypothetical protein
LHSSQVAAEVACHERAHGSRLRKGDGGAPICFDARRLDKGNLVINAELGGTVPM